MESGVCQADRREGNAQPAVSRIERGSERSRANPQERLQHLAAGTAGAAAPQGAGYGAVTDRAAGKSIFVFQQINKSQWSLPI